MALRTAEAAVTRAQASNTNRPGMCQQWTRDLFNAPSVGDVDKDGDADAVDGWKYEKKKHTDRNPPRGAVVSWSGGSHGHGHRAISLGNDMIRSIDAGGPGRVATVHLNWVEKHWGLKYEGWSETVSGIHIPGLVLPIVIPPKPKPKIPAKKTVALLAQEVLDGQWGNGDERTKRLTDAGYNAKSVQAKVNSLLNK